MNKNHQARLERYAELKAMIAKMREEIKPYQAELTKLRNAIIGENINERNRQKKNEIHQNNQH